MVLCTPRPWTRATIEEVSTFWLQTFSNFVASGGALDAKSSESHYFPCAICQCVHVFFCAPRRPWDLLIEVHFRFSLINQFWVGVLCRALVTDSTIRPPPPKKKKQRIFLTFHGCSDTRKDATAKNIFIRSIIYFFQGTIERIRRGGKGHHVSGDSAVS